MKLTVFFVTIIALPIIVLAENALLKALPVTCSKNDPDYNECMLDFFQEAKTVFLGGIPKLSFPSLTPLRIKDIERKKDLIYFTGVSASLKNMEISGLENIKVVKNAVDFRDSANMVKADVAIVIPTLTCHIEYNVGAKVFGILLIENGGTVQFEIGKVEIRFLFRFGSSLKNGKHHTTVKVLRNRLKISDAKVQVDNTNFIIQIAINLVIHLYNINRPYVLAMAKKYLIQKQVTRGARTLVENLINGEPLSINKMLIN